MGRAQGWSAPVLAFAQGGKGPGKQQMELPGINALDQQPKEQGLQVRQRTPIIPQAHRRSPVRSNIADGAQASHRVGRATSGGFGGTHIPLISCYEQSRSTIMYPRGDRTLKGTNWWGTRSFQANAVQTLLWILWSSWNSNSSFVLLGWSGSANRSNSPCDGTCGVPQPIRYLVYEVQHIICFPKSVHPFPFQLSNIYLTVVQETFPAASKTEFRIPTYISIYKFKSDWVNLVGYGLKNFNITISYSGGLHRAVKCRW